MVLSRTVQVETAWRLYRRIDVHTIQSCSKWVVSLQKFYVFQGSTCRKGRKDVAGGSESRKQECEKFSLIRRSLVKFSRSHKIGGGEGACDGSGAGSM